MEQYQTAGLVGPLGPMLSAFSCPTPVHCRNTFGATTAAPAIPQESLCRPIPCKHSAPSLPRESPWVYSGELAFFWLIMSKYKSERRKRGYESFSMSP